MKYTTGKWKYDFDDETKSGLKVYTDDEMISDFVGGKNLAEAEANAKLIAAAPELLEALTILLEINEKVFGSAIIGKPARYKAKQAILKATA